MLLTDAVKFSVGLVVLLVFLRARRVRGDARPGAAFPVVLAVQFLFIAALALWAAALVPFLRSILVGLDVALRFGMFVSGRVLRHLRASASRCARWLAANPMAVLLDAWRGVLMRGRVAGLRRARRAIAALLARRDRRGARVRAPARAALPEAAGMSAVRPLLRVRDVAVRYIVRGRIFTRGRSDRWALRGVSFDVHAGETLGVVGRNGAGKTTLLRLLAGILGPDRGSIERAPGVRASLLSLQVGFLPQLTGRENATLSGMLLGLRRAEVAARLDSIVEFAELADVIDDPISTWSDGMRARLGFSVAYHADPDLLLLDEALGTGDAAFHEKSAAAMRERIRSDRTCVLVSHDAADDRSSSATAASGSSDGVGRRRAARPARRARGLAGRARARCGERPATAATAGRRCLAQLVLEDLAGRIARQRLRRVNSTNSGTLKAAMCAATWRRTASASSVEPGTRRTTAFTRSPISASGTPMTAASSISGCSASSSRSRRSTRSRRRG